MRKKITFNDTDVPQRVPRADARIFGELSAGVVPTFSGKTALAVLLKYFRERGALPDKSAEVLVPPWMGNWIYMTMQQHCFVARERNERARGVLVYHQWGFPQRMREILGFAKKHRLFVIEDCAHAFESYHEGKRLGTFGDAAIFSLGKFFPCVVGGAAYSADAAIRDFVSATIRARPPTYEKEAFEQHARYDKDQTPRETMELGRNYAIYDRLGTCTPRAWSIAARSIAQGALAMRKRNAEYLREELMPKDKFGLFKDDVAPWVFPLFAEGEKARRISRALDRSGIESGVYRFDVNRNMLDPEYRACVPIPCHDGISERELEGIVRVAKDAGAALA